MYDAGKIIPGVIIFVILITFPIWYNISNGKASTVPEPEKPVGKEKCIESTEYMRSFHMDLLNQWRDAVVRQGVRVYVASDGTEYEMSLSNTCMGCHTSKANFCQKCHDYAGVNPYCWDCHVEPVENQ